MWSQRVGCAQQPDPCNFPGFRHIIWLLTGGFFMTFLWSISLLICFPCFFIAKRTITYVWNPFHYSIRESSMLEGGINPLACCLWIFWLIFALPLTLGHLFFGGLLYLSYFGQPLARIHLRLIQYAFIPTVKVEDRSEGSYYGDLEYEAENPPKCCGEPFHYISLKLSFGNPQQANGELLE